MKYVDKKDAVMVQERKSVVVESVIQKMLDAGRKVSREILVDEAANAKHPLHKYFEWNDTTAGHKYRLQQATHMILATKFVVILQEENARHKDVGAPHVVRKLLPSGDEGFKFRATVLGEKDSRKELIDRKISVLKSWCASVIDISELNAVREMIEAAV